MVIWFYVAATAGVFSFLALVRGALSREICVVTGMGRRSIYNYCLVRDSHNMDYPP